MNPKPHSLEEFDLELQSLRGAVLAMGRTALEMADRIGELVMGNEAPDVASAKRLEKELDQSERRIDDQARGIVIRFQPVATDLREVTGAVRMATDLEEIGDDVRRFVEGGERLRAWIASDAERVLEGLWKASRGALWEAYEAFQTHDAGKADEVSGRKKGIRKEAEAARGHVAKSVARNERLAPAFVEAVSAAHLLERIGLRACGMAETVYFIETAMHRRSRGR